MATITNKEVGLVWTKDRECERLALEQQIFEQGFPNICWMCEPPKGFKTISEIQEHFNKRHQQWHP